MPNGQPPPTPPPAVVPVRRSPVAPRRQSFRESAIPRLPDTAHDPVHARFLDHWRTRIIETPMAANGKPRCTRLSIQKRKACNTQLHARVRDEERSCAEASSSGEHGFTPPALAASS